LNPAVWPPLEERALDFNGVLGEFMALLGKHVRIERSALDGFINDGRVPRQ